MLLLLLLLFIINPNHT